MSRHVATLQPCSAPATSRNFRLKFLIPVVFRGDAQNADAPSARFDHIIPRYYNKEDRARCYLENKDRWGIMRKFQTMSVSIAVVTLADVHSFANLATATAMGKFLAKAINGSA